MHDVMMGYLPLAALPHLATGIWMLGYPGLASWSLDGIDRRYLSTDYIASVHAVGPRLVRCDLPLWRC
jgi:hypothetical protein